jgi:hypothetical protein
MSTYGITNDRIVRIINDINDSLLDNKTRIQSNDDR